MIIVNSELKLNSIGNTDPLSAMKADFYFEWCRSVGRFDVDFRRSLIKLRFERFVSCLKHDFINSLIHKIMSLLCGFLVEKSND